MEFSHGIMGNTDNLADKEILTGAMLPYLSLP